MRICFYISSLSHGGAERVISNLANEMSRRGHNCTLITSYRTEWEYPLFPEVRRVALSPNYLSGFFKRNYYYITKCRQYIKDIKPDLFVSFMGEPNLRAILITIGMESKVILSVRNDPNKEYRGLLSRLLAKTLFPLADGAVFQTSSAQSWFPFLLQRKSTIIYNPVNSNFFDVNDQGEKKNVISVGRLQKQKNYNLLIEAFSKVKNHDDEKLIIYGSGNTTAFEQLAADLGIRNRIVFAGQIDDVANTIKSAKLYVLSSDYEGMPNALMEAMAIGLPCVSTDCPCGGPRLLFNPNIHKYLTPVGDVDALASKIQALLDDDDERKKLAIQCKKDALAFKSDKIFDLWENYFYEVVKRN